MIHEKIMVSVIIYGLKVAQNPTKLLHPLMCPIDLVTRVMIKLG